MTGMNQGGIPVLSQRDSNECSRPAIVWPVSYISIWTNSLLVPVYCACVSVVVLVLGAAFAARRTKHVHTRSQDAPSCDVADRKPVDGSIGGLKSLWEQFSNHGKRTNHAFVLVRLLVCLSLTCLFIAAAVLRKGHNDSWLGIGQPEWIQLALALTSVRSTKLYPVMRTPDTRVRRRIQLFWPLPPCLRGPAPITASRFISDFYSLSSSVFMSTGTFGRLQPSNCAQRIARRAGFYPESLPCLPSVPSLSRCSCLGSTFL